MGGLVEKIIPRNSTIPCARAQEFTTFKDGQTALAVHVVQGERELVSDCRSLARFELRGIPPMAAGAARIRVTYQVDADGLLSVAAREMRSGVEASITVKPSYGLGDDEVARMLQDSYNSAQVDMVARALREEQVEAERILLATQSALDTDAELLSDEEQGAIAQLMQGVRDATVRSNDTSIDADSRQNVLHDAVQALVRGTEEFAARRMDKSVRKVLAGKALDQV
jgi:molecular chaperone HscA